MMLVRLLPQSVSRIRLSLLAWEAVVAVTVAQGIANTLLGRTSPFQATSGWMLSAVLASCAVLVGSVWFSQRLLRILQFQPDRCWRTLVLVRTPLLILSLVITLVAYLSDYWYHHFITFLYPLPAVALLLAILLTAVAQEVLLRATVGREPLAVLLTLAACRHWALPISLLMLGLLQGSAYLWVIGNDFTRYWAIADAIGTMAGYPVSRHQPVYLAAGMHLHSIELPVFPIFLLISFFAFGHDTVGAHIPGLLANTALPLLLYAFYRRAGLGRPLAFAASCLVAILPPFRLYTLNAPVPDAVFVALLVGTGYLFLGLTRRGREGNQLSSGHAPVSRAAWSLFGLLAGLTALTRPDGLLFVAIMFAALAPNLFRPRLYLAVFPFLATVLPFSAMMMSTFGIPWPRNFGSSASLGNVTSNLDWLERYSLRWYAEPFDLSPPAFGMLVSLLALAALVGTLWLMAYHWQAAVLPLGAVLQIAFVFTIDPRVSGADQWFDFFRHISYGIPFLVLSILFPVTRILERLRFRLVSVTVLALLLLVVSAYGLRLLAFPSTSYGNVGRQFLTSDVWVSLPDIVSNRYELPWLSFVRREGVLVFDVESRYMVRHAYSVERHFDRVSSLSTGRGAGYQLSSLLVILFGSLFAVARASEIPSRRCDGDMVVDQPLRSG